MRALAFKPIDKYLMAMLLSPTADIAIENKSHLSQKHVFVCVYITNFPVQPRNDYE